MAANVEGQWIVFEIIVTATDNLQSHIQAIFEHSDGVSKLVVVAGTQKELTALKDNLRATGMYMKYGSLIEFDVISKYMGDLQ
jgi:hypothetical protein